MTGSLKAAIGETDRRRGEAGRLERGARHHAADDQAPDQRHHAARWPSATTSRSTSAPDAPAALTGLDLHAYIGQLEKRMREAAANLEFEEAARLRDEIKQLEDRELGLATARPAGRPRASGAAWKPARARATTSAAPRRPRRSRGGGRGRSRGQLAGPNVQLLPERELAVAGVELADQLECLGASSRSSKSDHAVRSWQTNLPVERIYLV